MGATYGAIDDVTVSVNNSQISQTRRGKWESGGIMGKAVQTDPEDWPNRLSVTFDFPNKALDWFVGLFESGKPNYNIMDTDYDNYVIGNATPKECALFANK